MKFEIGDLIFSEKTMKIGMILKTYRYDKINEACWILSNGKITIINSSYLYKITDKLAREVSEAIRYSRI